MVAADSDIEEEELQRVVKKIEKKLKKFNSEKIRSKTDKRLRLFTETHNGLDEDEPSSSKFKKFDCTDRDKSEGEINLNCSQNVEPYAIDKQRKSYLYVKINGQRKKLTQRLKRIFERRDTEMAIQKSHKVKALNKMLYSDDFQLRMSTPKILATMNLCASCDKPKLQSTFSHFTTSELFSKVKLNPSFSQCNKMGCCYNFSTLVKPDIKIDLKNNNGSSGEPESNNDSGMFNGSSDSSGVEDDQNLSELSTISSEEIDISCSCPSTEKDNSVLDSHKVKVEVESKGDNEEEEEEEDQFDDPDKDYRDIDQLIPSEDKYVAIDCEFVGLGHKGSISALGEYGSVQFSRCAWTTFFRKFVYIYRHVNL